MSVEDLVGLGAAEIAQLIRLGQVAPIDAADAHIAQIEAVNPSINAMVTPMFDEAREKALLAGEQLSRRSVELPPLFGVPVTVKDSLAVSGVRFTAGSIHRRHHIADKDAEAVRRFKEAGAIILGKTNCCDMSGVAETTNPIFGLTRNPWNQDRSAGGSSGGEGALIAAGGSPLGIGTDIGGSIRIPAAFCGVVGMKPSGGLVPTSGLIPLFTEPLTGWYTAGPLARRVEDLALALSLLADDPIADYRSVTLESRTILMPHFLKTLPVSGEIAAAVKAAGEVLSEAGMKISRETEAPLMDVSLESSAIMYREWLPRYRAALGGGQPVRLITEIMANLTGRGRISSPSLAPLALLGLFGPILQLFGYGRTEQLNALRDSILDAMGPGGLILWAAFPTTAPRHGFSWRPTAAPSYTSIFNPLGLPAIALPIGFSDEGLPLSVQIVGRPREDAVVLAVAAVLEREFGSLQIAPCT